MLLEKVIYAECGPKETGVITTCFYILTLQTDICRQMVNY